MTLAITGTILVAATAFLVVGCAGPVRDFTAGGESTQPEPQLCESPLPWFNRSFQGQPVPFNAYLGHNGRHFWAWRRRGWACLIEMVDV